MIGFTCGLMNDPTPLVEHVYETYVEMFCNVFNPACAQSNIKTQRQLLAQGKDVNDTGLFNRLYTESRVPLFGHAHYNQFVCENHEGEIDTPSKFYAFVNVREDNVPVTKFAEQGGIEAPECVLCIQKPDTAAIKNLLLTCCKISKHQPVTHLIIGDVTCKNLTLAEALALSRNVQIICVANCDLPMSFWKVILHQLFDCVNLRSLLFENTNLHQLEEDLDELFKNLDGNTGLANHQVQVVLSENNFSKKLVNKWNGSSSGISCTFDGNFLKDDLTLDEINWLIGEQDHTEIEMYLSRKNITADLINHLKISEPVGRLILQDCRIPDGAVFKAFLGLTANDLLTVLDLSNTKLGPNAMHISSLVARGHLKQLFLRHCAISSMTFDVILPVLSSCKELTHLNLYGNNLEACGHHVAGLITAWGDKPNLMELNLGHCSLTREACMELLLALENCKSLTTLNMTANSIQGCLNTFLAYPWDRLHFLGKLFLDSTSLNRLDMLHLIHLIEKRKLPKLEKLNLGSNALYMMEAVVENLLEACVTNHTTELKVYVGVNDLSVSVEDKCKSLCDGTLIELHSVGYCIDLPWTKDESLEGFYDTEDTVDRR